MNTPFASIILAGGKGTRMNVPYPKVLSELGDKTLVEYAVAAHEEAGASRVIVTTGYKAELVREVFGDRVEYAHQEEQLGTGHAVQQVESLLADWEHPVLMTLGDMPFITPALLRSVLEGLQDGAACALLGARWPTDRELPAWGRFIRDEASGDLLEIVEEKDATDVQKQIRELNASVYAVSSGVRLFEALRAVDNQNAQEEYYLTDIVSVFRAQGERVVPILTDEVDLLIGVNRPEQLEEARAVLRASKDV